jgi:hypothetical protein
MKHLSDVACRMDIGVKPIDEEEQKLMTFVERGEQQTNDTGINLE